MAIALKSQQYPSMPRRWRLAQALACLGVALATLNVARESITPALQLGPMPFALKRGTAPSQRADSEDLAALTAPGLALVEVIVQRDDSLDRIFRRLRLSVTDLANVRALSGARAMLDRLTPGERLLLLHRDGALVGLERHVSLTQKLEVRRTDAGFEATVVAKPIETTTSVTHGVIGSSLFESANDAGLSDATVLKLAKIFGSDIDFMLGLRSGDEFTVEYERINQNGQYVKDGEILAARFVNQGQPYVAVRFVGPDGVGRYYTPDGRSLEKAFLRAPLEFLRVSSGFSSARLHPILNLIRAHKGTDYAAPMGTPVYAAGAGRVTFRGEKGGYGNVIEIDHGGGIVTVYGHMSRFAALKAGAHVQQGETIGYVGMTGLATGPHLHYEFHVNGKFVDPQKIKLTDAGPIDLALRAQFESMSAPLLAALNPAAARQVAVR
jgi:murein DD-endopeptidase MepM/ murein hydrolase activator NlpD